MNNAKFFIMQGRLRPDNLARLQVFPETQWREEMLIAQSLGFAGLELLYDKERRFITLCVADDQAKMDIRLWSNAGATPSVCLDLFSFYDYCLPDYWLDLQRAVEIIKEFDINIAVLPVLSVKTEAQLMQFLSLFQKNLLAHAKPRAVNFALEINLPAASIKKCMRSFQYDGLGICFDTGNSQSHGRLPEKEILALGSLIHHVHIKDVDSQGKNSLLGTGLVDFTKCFQALSYIKYSGVFVFETAYFSDPYKEAQRNYLYLSKK